MSFSFGLVNCSIINEEVSIVHGTDASSGEINVSITCERSLEGHCLKCECKYHASGKGNQTPFSTEEINQALDLNSQINSYHYEKKENQISEEELIRMNDELEKEIAIREKGGNKEIQNKPQELNENEHTTKTYYEMVEIMKEERTKYFKEKSFFYRLKKIFRL